MVAAVVAPVGLKKLFSILGEYGQVHGLVERNGAACFGPVNCFEDLSWRPTPETHSPKKLLTSPRETLFTGERGEDGWRITEHLPEGNQVLFGVRPCELQAIRLLDQVFGYDRSSGHNHHDAYYGRRRGGTLLVAFNCLEPHEHCFCASFGTGPFAGNDARADLLVTPLDGEFLVEAASEVGGQILGRLGGRQPEKVDWDQKESRRDRALAAIRTKINTETLPALMEGSQEHPYWHQAAQRCLSCGNCAMVCPSCFCHDISDRTDLHGDQVRRVRTWQVCLGLDFARVHGGNFRSERESRLRQFYYHKLRFWPKQFGVWGCTGCGRCSYWCPAGLSPVGAVEELEKNREVTP